MRFQSISGTSMWIEYPDYLIWASDNNTIKVGSSNPNDTVGARITMREPTLNQVVLDYWSETNEILFLLNDSIDQLFDDNLSEWDIIVEPYSNSTPQAYFLFHFKVLDGKSFQDKSHAAATTIYWSDINELRKLQLFSYEGGTATIGQNTFNLDAGINSLDVHSIVSGGETNIIMQANNQLPTTPTHLGDIWGENVVDSDDYVIKLVNRPMCSGSKMVRILYYDTDGCVRWIVGNILKETDNVSGQEYGRITEIYKNGAHKLRTSSTRTITVGFHNIDKTAQLNDIFYSNRIDIVNYDGQLVPAAIQSNKLTIEKVDKDLEIEFLINTEK